VKPQSKYIGAFWLVMLVVISFFKDFITPDYLNSPAANFLNPKHSTNLSIIELYYTYPLFWIKAHLYSALFVIIPSLIIYQWYNIELARITFIVLLLLYFLEYLIVWLHIPSLNIHLLPKLNRYFHSPFISLFFVAAFTLISPKE
jgi:hypothetical protein